MEKTRDYKLLVARKALSSFFNGFARRYFDVYVVLLGFNPEQLGLMRSVGMLGASLPISLIGFAADLLGRRKAYAAALALEVAAALAFALAGDWLLLTLGFICTAVTMYGLRPLEYLLLADTTPREERGLGIGIADSLALIASASSPIVAAVVIDSLGGISVGSLRSLFVIQLAGLASSAAIISLLRKLPGPANRGLREALREVVSFVGRRKWLERWILLEALGGYVFSMTMPYQLVYAIEYKGADEFVVGYMLAALYATSVMLSPLVGKLADKVGRVKTILLMRPLFAISTLTFLYAPGPGYLVLAFALLGAFFSSATAFQTLALELVPAECRGRWMGLRVLISLLARSPAPAIGGLLFMRVSPEAPFLVAIIIDSVLRVPLIYKTPETLWDRVE